MSDVYLYYFVVSNSQNGGNTLSARPATLEAIKRRGGEPLMDSQIVVDHTQLNRECFLVARVDRDSHYRNDIATQIWSLETRIASRNERASASTDEIEKYMLSLESRELSKQAQALKTRYTEIMADELGFGTDAKDLVDVGPGLAT